MIGDGDSVKWEDIVNNGGGELKTEKVVFWLPKEEIIDDIDCEDWIDESWEEGYEEE